jgi:heterokaryon incompatibility protein (HET)
LFDQDESSAVSYDALSYTWGDLSTTYPLICGGKELRIHHNLHQALPYLANRPSTLPLWIDAMCINQADGREKMEQIRLMSEIYRRGACVWAWLGVGQDPGAFDAVSLYYRAWEKLVGY